MGVQRTLGINGLGRIGKLTLWYHLGRDDFDRIVVNVGRPVGTSLDAVVQYIAKDSTYGPLHRFLFGQSGVRDIRVVDEERGLISAYGKEIVVLREARDPRDIPWRDHGVSLVVECTGTFRDPHAEPDAARGIAARPPRRRGPRRRAELAVQEQAARASPLPDDAAILIHGINDYEFDPATHKLVSAASCTTTALAHMMRPLLDRDLTRNMITAGMSTVHAVTNSQPVLDAVPEGRRHRPAQDAAAPWATWSSPPPTPPRRSSRSCPRSPRIGFMADSVRIPTPSVSLIILNVTFQSEALPDGTVSVERDAINAIYREAAEGEAQGPAQVQRRAERVRRHAGRGRRRGHRGRRDAHAHRLHGPQGARQDAGRGRSARPVRVPLTHVKIFGWYDNEMGSYTYRLGELTTHVARSM